MNKRGQLELPWLWITYLVLVGVAIAVFMNFVSGQERNMQEFYLSDITFLVNEIISAEFDEEYEYKIAEKFLVEITDEEVKVGLDDKVLTKKHIKNKHKIVYERDRDKLILKRR